MIVGINVVHHHDRQHVHHGLDAQGDGKDGGHEGRGQRPGRRLAEVRKSQKIMSSSSSTTVVHFLTILGHD